MSTKITFEDGKAGGVPKFKPLDLVCPINTDSSLIVQCCIDKSLMFIPGKFWGIVIRKDDDYLVEAGYYGKGWPEESFKIWPGKIIMESNL